MCDNPRITREAVRMVLAAFERHLPGKHNQLDHGRRKLSKLFDLADLGGAPPVPRPTQHKSTGAPSASVERLRRVERDAVMAMAEMAMDVEENVAKGASDEAIILLVRKRVGRLRLKPIEKAGATVPYDPSKHDPMRPGIPAGRPVLVVRPGYAWESPNGPEVLKRPLVQD